MNRLFQKKRNRGLRTYFFEPPPPWIFLFLFFTLHLKIPDKTKPHPWKFQTFLLDPLKFQVQKPRNSTLFFLVTPSKSTSFLINPWKFYMLFLWYPWKICILNPPVLFFFWNSPIFAQVLPKQLWLTWISGSLFDRSANLKACI